MFHELITESLTFSLSHVVVCNQQIDEKNDTLKVLLSAKIFPLFNTELPTRSLTRSNKFVIDARKFILSFLEKYSLSPPICTRQHLHAFHV
jgi:benzoyl-CoA reductase/2-hydroxyglutaryl-CoA dehydratase subunit BcrC/BadD/HgdB